MAAPTPAAAAPRAILLLLCSLACLTTCALAGDRTLGTVSGPCKDQFNKIMKEQYAGDSSCADTIKAAMSTAPKKDADCPGGAKAGVGSDVHKCMSKNKATADAWISLIKTCEVLNVNERTGAGEAEAAADAKPSCFPRFNSLDAFKSYVQGSSGKSAAGAARAAEWSVLLAAAAAGVWALV